MARKFAGDAMRITFVLPDINMGGGTRVLAIHARELARRGHQVVVVATPPKPPPAPRWKDRLRGMIKGKTKTANVSAAEESEAAGKAYFEGSGVDVRVIESHRPMLDHDVPEADVVAATWWETAEWVAKFHPDRGAKAYFIQGYESYLPEAEFERVKATWRTPLKKIVISKWLAKLAEEQYGDEKVVIVPNGVDLEQFNVPSRGKQPKPTVGMLYSHVGIKRCDMMLRAFAKAKQRVPNLRLVAFGSVPVIDELPLPEGTEYWQDPPQEEICWIYAQCDAWLFGSEQEGFGLPILEAMACRTPVIATAAGAAPQILPSGGGTLVHSEYDMARTIIDFCEMPDSDWRAVSEAAYQNACRFTWEDSSRVMECALLQIAQRRRGRVAPQKATAPARPVKPAMKPVYRSAPGATPDVPVVAKEATPVAPVPAFPGKEKPAEKPNNPVPMSPEPAPQPPGPGRKPIVAVRTARPSIFVQAAEAERKKSKATTSPAATAPPSPKEQPARAESAPASTAAPAPAPAAATPPANSN